MTNWKRIHVLLSSILSESLFIDVGVDDPAVQTEASLWINAILEEDQRKSRLEGHWKQCPTFFFFTPVSPCKWDIPRPDDVESEESNPVPEPLRATLMWDAKTF